MFSFFLILQNLNMKIFKSHHESSKITFLRGLTLELASQR